MISAQRAYEIGLVNKVVPAAELMGAAREIAKKILSRGPVAVRTAKMAMNRGLDLDLGNACALEASLFAAGFSTVDREEGIAAFLEKRKANFTGK
jgi:enoyl-CoA hydratase